MSDNEIKQELSGDRYWCRFCYYLGPFPFKEMGNRGPVYECPQPECNYHGPEHRFFEPKKAVGKIMEERGLLEDDEET